MEHLLQSLSYYGFSTKESKVYLASLELGSAPWATIARRASEKRATVYSILKEFVKKGIATSVVRNHVTYFSVISPKILAENLENNASNFKISVPELLAITEKVGKQAKVQFFEGLEGIKHMYDQTLETPEHTLYAFLNPSIAAPELQSYLNAVYLPKRLANNMTAHVLLSGNQDHSWVYQPLKGKSKPNKLTQIRTAPRTLQCFDNEVNIFGKDKVCIFNFSSQEMSGIIIQSQSFYNTMKHIFEFIWSQSK